MKSYLGSGEVKQITLSLHCKECRKALEELVKLYELNTTRNYLVFNVKEDINAHGIHTHDHVLHGYVALNNLDKS